MSTTSPTHIRVISPASGSDNSQLSHQIAAMESEGMRVSYHKVPRDPSMPFYAGSHEFRQEQLLAACRAEDVTAILAARGGYGTSDLLPLLPWNDLKSVRPRPIIGFSDISALHAAAFSLLGWHGIHGPMPATDFWTSVHNEDVRSLMSLIRGAKPDIALPVTRLNGISRSDTVGWGFGGCLSVLTNLIGTPYLPQSLAGSILYWEDIGEHPGRILRFVNQWIQSGLLQGVRGLILGRFVGCDLGDQFSEMQLIESISQRVAIPTWFSPAFGHCSPNWPLPIGGGLRITAEALSWDWEASHARH